MLHPPPPGLPASVRAEGGGLDSNAEAQRKTNGVPVQPSVRLCWSIQTTPRTRPDLSTSISRAMAPLRIKSRPVWAAASKEVDRRTEAREDRTRTGPTRRD